MTISNIIIDGVDVSGCTSLIIEDTAEYSTCDEYLCGMCKGTDCLYKQLKRSQQENENLKRRLLWSKDLCFGFFLLNLKLREKNRRLYARLNKKVRS